MQKISENAGDSRNGPETYCSRCIYSSEISGISFDASGVCNFCKEIDRLVGIYGTGSKVGNDKWLELVRDIKKAGSGKKYDCIVGVSGGTDSSYLLLLATKHGLRPLAVHYDNSWNSALASMNIRRVTKSLSVDLYTHVVDNKEVDDIKRSILLAGIAEFDVDTDMALVQVIRSVAARNNVKYILEGHSFTEEGISPISGNYFDGGYLEDVHRRFGGMKMRLFPNMGFWAFLKWTLVYRQKFVRPLWLVRYSKDEAKVELSEKTGWRDYGGHHLENRASAFYHTIYLPTRFNRDYRFLTVSAKVRNGLLSRERGIALLEGPIAEDEKLLEYALSRFGMTRKEYTEVMSGQTRTWRDFKTYKRRFELLRPLFYLLVKAGMVPHSFYIKYCFPIPMEPE
jgi:hypothetical protein